MAAPDWLAIEDEYRGRPKKSIRAIADDYGVSEKAIRNHAKKGGWTRDPAGTQREQVKGYFAGCPQASPQSAVRTFDNALERAIADNELALTNAELALQRVNNALQPGNPLDSGDLKRLSETNLINLNAIRTIFTLNDPNQRDGVDYDDLPFPD